jgi:phosphoglycerol transferase MdoB-like AlkP superfamily enzyme
VGRGAKPARVLARAADPPFVAVALLDARYKEFSSDAQANEIAGNGYFDFWHAFWSNEIDYDRFYKTLSPQRALAALANELSSPRLKVEVSQRPYEREVVNEGPRKPLNVVLISVESYSAEFMAAFGNRQGLTPYTDSLATQGLLFTHLFATGTRTVRGLEALTLSVPPTPGHSIVKRPNNDHLFTLGEIFKETGYEALYLYGGYGYFDNMNAFFSGNGYTVIDRTALKPEDIHFENIWGVADEDLFSLALRELDQRHASGVKFFAHVMTTTNHRPFTYPDGRIDIPSKSGREGGVKYTDWAIGNFIERARARPWFDDTVFVIVADHTHKGRGRQELPLENYHIPMIIYAPAHLQPRRIDTIASQIDVAPTVLGLLDFSYRSKFFGHDILREGQTHQRALMANYQTVGYYEQGRIVELKPNGRTRVVDAATGAKAPDDALSRELVDDTISYYQVAAQAYRRGDLKGR